MEYFISGINIMSAPPAIPALSAICPASRPITSSIIDRLWLAAVDVATQALDNLQSTAASHRRSMILEVMGRDAGHIALNAGIAGGADIILIPEIKYSIKGIIKK